MKVLYGTTNPGKLNSMRRHVKSLDLEIIGLNDLNQPLPVVNENGNNPLENAEIKARAYYEAFHMPVFSCDSGLYFEELEESLQPGTYIRRVNGRNLNDEEMIEYYSNLAKRHNNKLTARYKNAIYFIVDDNTCFSSMNDALSGRPFLIVGEAHEKRVEGYPLDSLSVEITSGKYYYDIDEKEKKKEDVPTIGQACRKFFFEALVVINVK